MQITVRKYIEKELACDRWLVDVALSQYAKSKKQGLPILALEKREIVWVAIVELVDLNWYHTEQERNHRRSPNQLRVKTEPRTH